MFLYCRIWPKNNDITLQITICGTSGQGCLKGAKSKQKKNDEIGREEIWKAFFSFSLLPFSLLTFVAWIIKKSDIA
jgi:hypothetical protein